MSDEITRLLDGARDAAPSMTEASRRAVVVSVLNTLDELIEEAGEDAMWPDPGDLGLLARDVERQG
ncbi:hypothetical protein [Amycolatopsis lurida]|uniref:hypothetical protein n=1 Tax=Amycolatopsis lurida TaxID=31959 RepID=UPI0036598082